MTNNHVKLFYCIQGVYQNQVILLIKFYNRNIDIEIKKLQDLSPLGHTC